jgi:peroxiredoxin
MTLQVGEKIPDVPLTTMSAHGPAPVSSVEVLGSGRVVLFAVPGAFTPGCTDHHLPSYVLRADEILAKGVDRIACLAVNDSFVMNAWGQANGVDDKILMLSDGNGSFVEAAGMQLDGSAFGLGTRSKRYAAVIQDGVVQELLVEPDGVGVSVSAADGILERL